MTQLITDGTGSGAKAKVDECNRLHTDNVTHTHSDEASIEGNAFNINTGLITLTTAGTSSLLYIKNNDVSRDIIISKLAYIFGSNTGGSGDTTMVVNRNPTGGTIVSDAVDAEMAGINRNFGSSTVLVADIYKGGEGKTDTGGGKIVESLFGAPSFNANLDVGFLVLPHGSSISFEVTPASGTTAQDVEIAVNLHTEIAGT